MTETEGTVTFEVWLSFLSTLFEFRSCSVAQRKIPGALCRAGNERLSPTLRAANRLFSTAGGGLLGGSAIHTKPSGQITQPVASSAAETSTARAALALADA